MFGGCSNRTSLWIWLIVGFLFIIISISGAESEGMYQNIWLTIAGIGGLITVIMLFAGLKRWWRDHHPWDMNVISSRPWGTPDSQQRPSKKLEISLGRHIVLVGVKTKQPTRPARIRTVEKPRFKRYGLRGFMVYKYKYLLRPEIPRNKAPDDCPLQISKVRDVTQFMEVHGVKSETRRGLAPSAWWLLYPDTPSYEVPSEDFIRLELDIEATSQWEGEIEFSGYVKGTRRHVQMEVEVKEEQSMRKQLP